MLKSEIHWLSTMRNGKEKKNQSPHAWSNILFTTNLQIYRKGIVIPDIKDISKK